MKKLFKKLIELLYLSQDNNLAYYDILTGYHNYNWLHLVAEKKYRNKEIFVTIIDINHFKDINDHYGHEFGNKVLKNTTLFIRETLGDRGTEFVRYGGDEFIILSTVRSTAALERSGLNSIAFGYRYKTKDMTLQEAIKLADRSMYIHKMKIKTVNGDINRTNILNTYRNMYKDSLKELKEKDNK